MSGTFFWYELLTPDPAAAFDFYGHVIGWTFARMEGDDMPYTIISAGDRPVGGVFGLTDEMQAGGARPTWLGYIEAADTDAKTEEVVAAGGSLMMPPRDVPGAGRISMVADPGGAPFYLMTPKPPEGAEGGPGPLPPTTPGAFSWRELYASQGQQAAFDFYAGLFGWESMMEMEMGAMGVYRLWGKDGVQLGGMMDKPASLPVSFWGFYTTVDGIDAAIERLKEKGGQVLNGPHQVPGGSWIVQAMDPQGAAFALTSATK